LGYPSLNSQIREDRELGTVWELGGLGYRYPRLVNGSNKRWKLELIKQSDRRCGIEEPPPHEPTPDHNLQR